MFLNFAHKYNVPDNHTNRINQNLVKFVFQIVTTGIEVGPPRSSNLAVKFCQKHPCPTVESVTSWRWWKCSANWKNFRFTIHKTRVYVGSIVRKSHEDKKPIADPFLLDNDAVRQCEAEIKRFRESALVNGIQRSLLQIEPGQLIIFNNKAW